MDTKLRNCVHIWQKRKIFTALKKQQLGFAASNCSITFFSWKSKHMCRFCAEPKRHDDHFDQCLEHQCWEEKAKPAYRTLLADPAGGTCQAKQPSSVPARTVAQSAVSITLRTPWPGVAKTHSVLHTNGQPAVDYSATISRLSKTILPF